MLAAEAGNRATYAVHHRGVGLSASPQAGMCLALIWLKPAVSVIESTELLGRTG